MAEAMDGEISETDSEISITTLNSRFYDFNYPPQLPTVEEFIQTHETDIDAKNRAGNTALMNACRNGNVGLVKLLLEKGANINVANEENGNTALHVACQYGRPLIGGNRTYKGRIMEADDETTLSMIKLLLENNTAVQTNKDGLSPVDVAALNKKTKTVDHFVDSGFISPSEQIKALEILGMSLGIYEEFSRDAYKALHRAMVKRQEHNVPKSEGSMHNLESFFGRSESRSLKELEKVKWDGVRAEAFLVGERVLPDQLKEKYVYTPIAELGLEGMVDELDLKEMVDEESNLEEAFKIFSFCLLLERKGLLWVGCVLCHMEEGVYKIARYINQEENKERFISHVCNILAAYPDVLGEVECAQLSAYVDRVVYSMSKILYHLTYDQFCFSLTDAVFDHVADILTTIWGRIPKPVYNGRDDKDITTSVCHSVLDIMVGDSCSGALRPSGSQDKFNLFTRLIAKILQVEDALDVTSSGKTMFQSLMDLLSCQNYHMVMDIARLLLRHGCPNEHIDISTISIDSCVEGIGSVMSLMEGEVVLHGCFLPSAAKELSDLIEGRQEILSLQELSVRAVHSQRIPYRALLPRSLWRIVQDPILLQPETSFTNTCSQLSLGWLNNHLS